MVSGATHAQNQERWDHRGSIGLLVGGGVEARSAIGPSGQGDTGVRLIPEVGGTFALSERLNLKISGRVGLLGPALTGMALAGVRSLYGERFKTFFDLEASVTFPVFTIGPKVAFGVQYELLNVIGAFASGGVNFGVGPTGARLGFELMLGFHFRTYLFEAP
jgi:hypothetical protein